METTVSLSPENVFFVTIRSVPIWGGSFRWGSCAIGDCYVRGTPAKVVHGDESMGNCCKAKFMCLLVHLLPWCCVAFGYLVSSRVCIEFSRVLIRSLACVLAAWLASSLAYSCACCWLFLFSLFVCFVYLVDWLVGLMDVSFFPTRSLQHQQKSTITELLFVEGALGRVRLCTHWLGTLAKAAMSSRFLGRKGWGGNMLPKELRFWLILYEQCPKPCYLFIFLGDQKATK